MITFDKFVAGAFLFASLGSQGWAQSNPPVPPTYQDLYDQLNGQISSFSSTIHASWDGTPYPVSYSAHLLSADSENATSLINSGYYAGSVTPELNAIQALGVKSVTTHINFPILYQNYYSADPQDYQSFVSFYQQLSQDVHSRGMTLVIETATNSALAGTNGGTYSTYYQSLSWTDYMNGRAQNALNVAQLIQPDYLSVITEPDSEASDTGQTNAGTISGSLQELGVILGAIQGAGATTPIGAGAGTWISSFTQWIQAFAGTSVQYIDIHIYPPNKNFLPNALTAADTAHAAQKPIAMTESWCEKVRDSELGSNTVNFNDVEARYVFSFWAPIDSAFMQSMVDMSQYKQFLFIAPSWTRYFFAYLDYSVYGSITDDDTIETDAEQAAAVANNDGAYTSTGLAWENMIIPAPDTMPPSVPAAPTLTAVSLNVVSLAWTPSTDNVGVAAYNLYRNGTWITTTSNLTWADQTVASGTTYNYTLTAFDAPGNQSAPSAPLSVTTLSPPDTQPPSMPTNLTGNGLSDKQTYISWSPSTDNVAVAGYRIYRGSSPSALTLINSIQTPNYTDSNNIVPGTTYYYAVAAYDAVNNSSPQTAPVAVASLPDTTAPTMPAQLTATAVSSTQINLSWLPSTDDVGVAGYRIYRGKSATSLTLVGSTSSLSYCDKNSISPSQIYYYAIAAFDAAMNYSPQTAVISVSPVPDTQPPTTPNNLTGVPLSTSQIEISWSPSTDNISVAGYKVYRGTSPSPLTLWGSTTATSYTDNNNVGAGKSYYYAVAAYDSSQNYSAQTAPIVVTSFPDAVPPTTPANVQALALSDTQIALSWSASMDNLGISRYTIFRGTSPDSLTTWGSTQSLSFTDGAGVAPATTYYYSIAAIDTSGNQSALSDPVTVSSFPDVTPPSVPADFTAQATDGPEVTMSWSASTDDYYVATYRIYRGSSPTSLTLLAVTGGTTYVDLNVKPGTVYYYTVSAKDPAGNESAQTAPLTVTTTDQ